jgi:alpha-beta hydrolase superfamily lysophospholipase
MKQFSLRLIMCGMILVLLMTACASPPSATPTPTVTLQPPRIEEIAFESGSFHVVGDLRLPEGVGPFPVVVFVHGSGPIDRTMFGEYMPIMERMLRAGYATFSWDKPGTGESTGQISSNHVFAQRAQILLDAIEIMQARPDIDPQRIGLWGISQAGYVMPLALTQTKDIAFMICVSCPGMSGYDQMAFNVTAWALCSEVPEEKADQKTRLLAELDRARTYDTYAEYLHYREVLKALAGLVSAPIEQWPVLSEETWQQNPTDPEDVWNPIEVIEQLGIPVLAIFGDQDRSVDPLQGAYAYRQALEQAGNPKSRVELFPKARHELIVSKTGCPIEEEFQWLEQYVKTLGYGSVSEAEAAVEKDPRLHGDFLTPGYLDLIEEWLRDLRR